MAAEQPPPNTSLTALATTSPSLSAKGKYLVRRAEGDVWKPASELLFHSSAQLEAARAAAQVSKQAATQAAVEDEMRAPHAVGDVVYVKTSRRSLPEGSSTSAPRCWLSGTSFRLSR